MIGPALMWLNRWAGGKVGHHISFIKDMKECWWPMIITIVLCNIYLLIVILCGSLTMSR